MKNLVENKNGSAAESSLWALGLSKYESAVFISLLRLGSSSAKDISASSGVPPTAVYPNLKSLVAKGLVQRLASDKGIFEALEPKTVLPALAERRQKMISGHADAAIESLSSIQRDPLKSPEPVSLSLGLEQSHQLFLSFSERTKKTFYVVGWSFRNMNSYVKIEKMLMALVRRKVDVRIISEQKTPVIMRLAKLGVDVRINSVPNFSIMVRDASESKVTLKNPALPERLNMHVHDPDLSKAFSEYFLIVWKRAKKLN